MAGETARTKANVVYLLQNHARPAQVPRLVRVITEGSPDVIVLISHDKSGPALDAAGLRALGNVHVLVEQGGYATSRTGPLPGGGRLAGCQRH